MMGYGGNGAGYFGGNFGGLGQFAQNYAQMMGYGSGQGASQGGDGAPFSVAPNALSYQGTPDYAPSGAGAGAGASGSTFDPNSAWKQQQAQQQQAYSMPGTAYYTLPPSLGLGSAFGIKGSAVPYDPNTGMVDATWAKNNGGDIASAYAQAGKPLTIGDLQQWASWNPSVSQSAGGWGGGA